MATEARPDPGCGDAPPDMVPAHGGPRGRAVLRATAEDFQVREIMAVVPEGEGEHLWLDVEKTNWNTEDVALWLAKQAGLPRRAVGYSGLKDRRAVTRQWFSLHLPGKSGPEFDAAAGLSIHQAVRHRRKLHRGTHRGNHFTIVLRAVAADRQQLETVLANVRAGGVPNYFGTQRFGRGGANWTRGCAWLRGGEAPRKRALRGFWLSAVRSGLFNAVLAERVRCGVWRDLLAGDWLQPDGSHGLFHADQEPDAARRVAAGEVHPTAPLPGMAGVASSGPCAALEQRVLQPYRPLLSALAEQRVEAARRATRLPVRALQWDWQGDQLLLDFELGTGAFATAVLGELVRVQ